MSIEDLRESYAEHRARARAAARAAGRAACEDPEVRRLVETGLTVRQAEMFLFVFRSTLSRGIQPTIRQIGEHFGITSTNGVVVTLKAIARKGWWELSPDGSSRSLRFRRKPDGSPFEGFVCR
jgi:repressor LexA